LSALRNAKVDQLLVELFLRVGLVERDDYGSFDRLSMSGVRSRYLAGMAVVQKFAILVR